MRCNLISDRAEVQPAAADLPTTNGPLASGDGMFYMYSILFCAVCSDCWSSCGIVSVQKYSPAAAELPTTNGPWATGDGIELGSELGAALVGMEHVQVHPTGFVDPADPTAGTKVCGRGIDCASCSCVGDCVQRT